jgi:DNA-binding IclR family transcriptional regulator
MNTVKASPSATVQKALRAFQVVAEGSFGGVTLEQVQQEAGLPRSTAFRYLCTWEEMGWLKSTGSNRSLWLVSERLLQLAHRHRRQVISQLREIHDSYASIAGEELIDEKP